MLACARCRRRAADPVGLRLATAGWVSLARYRMAFYDTALDYAVRYARHALSIDENRANFDCIPWDEEAPGPPSADRARDVPERFKQVWFAGNHSDIGGSYPETESRLSDISLDWMVEEAMSLPDPIHIDHTVLNLYPDCAGAQHDEREAFLAARPAWLVGWRCGLVEPETSAGSRAIAKSPRRAAAPVPSRAASTPGVLISATPGPTGRTP